MIELLSFQFLCEEKWDATPRSPKKRWGTGPLTDLNPTGLKAYELQNASTSLELQKSAESLFSRSPSQTSSVARYTTGDPDLAHGELSRFGIRAVGISGAGSMRVFLLFFGRGGA